MQVMSSHRGVAGVLHLWGCTRDIPLRLGTTITGGDPILLPGDEDATTIWIHNDNAAEKFPGTIGHYSGLVFKEFVIYGEDDTSDAGADEPNALVPGDHVDE